MDRQWATVRVFLPIHSEPYPNQQTDIHLPGGTLHSNQVSIRVINRLTAIIPALEPGRDRNARRPVQDIWITE